MITLLIDNFNEVIKRRAKLEKLLDVKILNLGKEISINGEADDEYLAEKVIVALAMKFPFAVALSIKEGDNHFEILNIKDYTKRKDFASIRARVIGAKGKTLRTLTELTKCHFEIKDNEVGIIGDPEYMKNAQQAIIMLIQGSKQANVYAYLEKHQVQPILDLGLKEPKKKKAKK